MDRCVRNGGQGVPADLDLNPWAGGGVSSRAETSLGWRPRASTGPTEFGCFETLSGEAGALQDRGTGADVTLCHRHRAFRLILNTVSPSPSGAPPSERR